MSESDGVIWVDSSSKMGVWVCIRLKWQGSLVFHAMQAGCPRGNMMSCRYKTVPGCEQLRPTQRSPIPNFYLAGADLIHHL